MESNQIAKVESLLNSLPEGYSNYLKICLDPFHDKTIRFEGAPTSRNASSVTLCLNQEQVYTAADFALVTDPTWDAHFSMFPFLGHHDVQTGFYTNPPNFNEIEVSSGSPVSFTLYPMSVCGVNTGTPTYAVAAQGDPLNVLGLDAQSLLAFVTNPAANEDAAFRTLRIVGQSFEVIDESPDIYQQGALTVYRYPLDQTAQQWYFRTTVPAGDPWDSPTDGSIVRTLLETYALRTPPTNTATAVLVTGSDTWKAREGCYVVGTAYESEIPFKQVDYKPINLIGSCPASQPNYQTGYYKWIDENIGANAFQAYNLVAGPDPINLGSPDAVFPFNLSGAYFTGLSTQYGVLRLRYRLYVEILSDPQDNTLAPLASPTIPFEQTLAELVMRTVAEQPAGVPQSWNPKGEAWRRILGTVSKVSDALAGPLSALYPNAGLILMGAGGLARNQLNKSKKKKNANTAVPKPPPVLISSINQSRAQAQKGKGGAKKT